MCTLEETAILEVVLDDDISDSVKHKLDVVGVGGTCEVGIDLLLILAFVQILKLHLDVGGCLFICVGAWLGEAEEKGGKG